MMGKIAVSAMQLDHVVADTVHALCGCGEFAHNALNVVFGHGVRHRPSPIHRELLTEPPASRRRVHRENRLASSGGRRGRPFAARMRELYAEFRHAILTAEVVHPLEGGLVVVRPHARAFWRDAALRIDVRHLAHHQAGGTERHIAKVHQVPVVGRAVVRIVLAHGRDHDPVRQGQTTHGDGREQNASRFRDASLSVRTHSDNGTISVHGHDQTGRLAQNTQYSIPPITQIQLLVTL